VLSSWKWCMLNFLNAILALIWNLENWLVCISLPSMKILDWQTLLLLLIWRYITIVTLWTTSLYLVDHFICFWWYLICVIIHLYIIWRWNSTFASMPHSPLPSMKEEVRNIVIVVLSHLYHLLYMDLILEVWCIRRILRALIVTWDKPPPIFHVLLSILFISF
jgi:hypothetical protein